MATDRQASRLALEAIAITLSILAAFAIDAWWEGRGQRQEELQIVGTLLDEMTTNRERLAEKREWQAGLEEATNTLLAASAEAPPTLDPDSLDHLLGDASWWNGHSSFEMSAVNALVSGGGLASLSDPALRQALTEWQSRIEVVELNERQDYDAFFGVWMPFLSENANLPQISNAIVHVPGDINEPNFGDSVPVTGITDHTPLLNDQAFRNLLLQRKWIHDDILNQYDELEPHLELLISILAAAAEGEAS